MANRNLSAACLSYEINGAQHIPKAMHDLVKLRMSPSSLGFNLYLLSKMHQFTGDVAGATEFSTRCREETPSMYAHLMAQDANYDLRQLERMLNEACQPNTRDQRDAP